MFWVLHLFVGGSANNLKSTFFWWIYGQYWHYFTHYWCMGFYCWRQFLNLHRNTKNDSTFSIFSVDFDKLGLTDNQNPLGVLPPLLARSMGRAAGSILADYVSDYMRTRRRKRNVPNFTGNENFKITTNFIDGEDTEQKAPVLPDEHKHAFHGGERWFVQVNQ